MSYCVYLFKSVFFPTRPKQINPAPSSSMVMGSGILENEKGTVNAGLTEIVVIAAIDTPTKNNFIIAPPDNTDLCFWT